jgi:molybdopterin-guanine dinucleotide biosynthesis protein A
MDGSSVAAAIVAGGRARRFAGRDKSRLLVEGRPIITRQLDVLQQLTARIFIVSNDPVRFADLDVPVYPDRVPDAGVIGGIDAALHAADADCVIAVACDMPFLHAGLLDRLVEASADADGAWVRTERGIEPLLACYRARARAAVAAAIRAGRLKAARLGEVLDMREIGPDEIGRFGSPDRLLANVNTPDDHARVQ